MTKSRALRALVPSLFLLAGSPLLAADAAPASAAPAPAASAAPAEAPAPAAAATPVAPPTDGPLDFLAKGTASASVRYRLEHVEQAVANGSGKDANASTARIAVGYETKPIYGLSAFAEFEGVFLVGQQLYSAPDAVMANYPVVNDPTASELNQGYAKYAAPVAGITAKVGRFEYLLGNQRLVGNVGWRQNRQSFDGATISASPVKGDELAVDATYAYLKTAHRIFSDESVVAANPGQVDLNGHAGNVSAARKGLGSLTGYAALLGFDRGVPAALLAQSSQTYGVRLAGPAAIGSDLKLLYTAEAATQREWKDNPNEYRASYLLGELGVGYQGYALTAGWNQIGGTTAADRFTTPLATGHAFNGWADVFLTTPTSGLTAYSITATAQVPAVKGLSLMAVAYDFRSQDGSFDYGKEFDLRAEYSVLPVDKRWLVGLKFARFIGDDDVARTGSALNDGITKAWLYTQYAF